jgi:hypothetical protein
MFEGTDTSDHQLLFNISHWTCVLSHIDSSSNMWIHMHWHCYSNISSFFLSHATMRAAFTTGLLYLPSFQGKVQENTYFLLSSQVKAQEIIYFWLWSSWYWCITSVFYDKLPENIWFWLSHPNIQCNRHDFTKKRVKPIQGDTQSCVGISHLTLVLCGNSMANHCFYYC